MLWDKRKVMAVGFRRWIQPLCWLIALLLLTGGAIWGYEYFSVATWQTLDPGKLTGLAQTGAIYDKDGNYVTTLVGRENRTVIDTASLPRHVVDAFLAAEDLRFYKHPGFDIVRIFGAVMAITQAFGVCDVPMALAGYPSTDYAARTVVTHLFDYGFSRFEMGYASAIATMLFLVMILCKKFISAALEKVGT